MEGAGSRVDYPGHHGWPAAPEAIFLGARSLATIQTLPNWPKIRHVPPPPKMDFCAPLFFFSFLWSNAIM